eukprot:3164386-Amphidinium_carterae.2
MPQPRGPSPRQRSGCGRKFGTASPVNPLTKQNLCFSKAGTPPLRLCIGSPVQPTAWHQAEEGIVTNQGCIHGLPRLPLSTTSTGPATGHTIGAILRCEQYVTTKWVPHVHFEDNFHLVLRSRTG